MLPCLKWSRERPCQHVVDEPTFDLVGRDCGPVDVLCCRRESGGDLLRDDGCFGDRLIENGGDECEEIVVCCCRGTWEREGLGICRTVGEIG